MSLINAWGRAWGLAGLALLIVLLGAAPLAAMTLPPTDPGDPTEEGAAPWTSGSTLEIREARVPWADHEGYLPIVVRLRSRAATTVTLHWRQGSIDTQMAGVNLPANRFVSVTLLAPAMSTYGEGMIQVVGEDGATTESRVDVTIEHGARRLVTVAVAGRAAPIDLIGKLDRYFSRGMGGYAGSSISDWWMELPATRFPDRWQAYPRWLAVLLTPESEATLTTAQRTALADWVRTGGTVLMSDPAQVARWRSQGLAVQDATQLAAPPERGKVGTDPLRVKPPARRGIDEPSPPNLDGAQAPRNVPVPGTDKMPVTGFYVLAILFTIIVGPLNLILLAKTNKRALLLVTTPALSLLTCVGLILWSVFAEGFATRRVVDQVVWLDNAHQQAVVWTGTSAFGPFPPTSFDLPRDSEAQPWNVGDQPQNDPSGYPGYRYGRSGGDDDDVRRSFSLTWTADGRQITSGDWLAARSNRQFLVTQVATYEARLLLRPVSHGTAGTGYELTNGLDQTIEWLLWRDADGRQWYGKDIAPGANVSLERCSDTDSKDDYATRVKPDATPYPALSRLGDGAKTAWDRASDRTNAVRARLAGPIIAPATAPGSDARPPAVWLCGPLTPGRATGGTP